MENSLQTDIYIFWFYFLYIYNSGNCLQDILDLLSTESCIALFEESLFFQLGFCIYILCYQDSEMGEVD